MHVGSKTLASVNLKFSKLGKCNLHFLPRGLNIGLIKILRSCAYLVRYALRARRATKALRCFTILTLTLFLRCIFQIPPCVNRKIVATRKCSWHVCASCHYDVSSFRHIQQNRTPARVNLWGWGVVAGSCWIVLKLRSSVTRFYAARLAARYLFFQLTSRLRVVLPRNF